MSDNRYTVLHKSTFFDMRRVKRRKTDKVYFEIRIIGFPPRETGNFFDAVRDIVDPQRNKSGQFGRHWKFRSHDEASQNLSMLLLRWA